VPKVRIAATARTAQRKIKLTPGTFPDDLPASFRTAFS
jgi:hypothetical protein